MQQRIKLSQYVSFWSFADMRYLFCSTSGALIKIDNSSEIILKSAKTLLDINDRQLADFCFAKGILVPANLDEFGQYQLMTYAEQFNIHPNRLSYTIAVTEHCNYHCQYCFEGNTSEKVAMSENVALKVVEFIQHSISFVSPKELHITWFGGEPLMNLKTIEQISDQLVTLCKKQNITYSASVITNGSLLTKEVLQVLSKCCVSFLQVTLDGNIETCRQYKGCSEKSYWQSISGIVEAAKYMRINVRFNTDGKNINSIIDALGKIRNLITTSGARENIRYYLAYIDTPNQCIMPDWFVTTHKKFLSYLSENQMKNDIMIALPKARYASCGAATNSLFFICANGDIVKCEHYLGMSNYRIGSVFDGLFHNAEENRFRDVLFEAKCKECSLFPICRQGCLNKRLDQGCRVNCRNFFENIGSILYALSQI